MKYILSTSYANETVAAKAYNRLAAQVYRYRATTNPIEVVIFDNHYPLNDPMFLPKLCAENGFMYNHAGENIGLYAACNQMISRLTKNCKSVIGFDGDNWIIEDDWINALYTVMEDETVGTAMVSTPINVRELEERGYERAVINGYRVKISKQALCMSVSCWNVPFLRAINGITAPHKYYGGNEVAMQDFYAQHGKKLVVLEDYHEELDEMKALQDWQYEEYKIKYAHQGLNMSFNEFLATNPVQIGRDVLLKSIFG